MKGKKGVHEWTRKYFGRKYWIYVTGHSKEKWHGWTVTWKSLLMDDHNYGSQETILKSQ